MILVDLKFTHGEIREGYFSLTFYFLNTGKDFRLKIIDENISTKYKQRKGRLAIAKNINAQLKKEMNEEYQEETQSRTKSLSTRRNTKKTENFVFLCAPLCPLRLRVEKKNRKTNIFEPLA